MKRLPNWLIFRFGVEMKRFVNFEEMHGQDAMDKKGSVFGVWLQFARKPKHSTRKTVDLDEWEESMTTLSQSRSRQKDEPFAVCLSSGALGFSGTLRSKLSGMLHNAGKCLRALLPTKITLHVSEGTVLLSSLLLVLLKQCVPTHKTKAKK